MSAKADFRIDFASASPQALQRLVKVVDTLSLHKSDDERPDEAYWRAMFTGEDLSAFWWPDEPELAAWNDFWFGTPLPCRHSAEMPMPPWEFMSMIESILGAEYRLVGLADPAEGVIALEFEPEAWPYGGTAALRALVRAFGHKIVGFTGDDGYVSGDPLPPRWAVSP